MIALPGGKRRGYAVVLDVDRRGARRPPGRSARHRGPTAQPATRRRPVPARRHRLPAPAEPGLARQRQGAQGHRRRAAPVACPGGDDPRREVRARVDRSPSTAANDEELQPLKAALAAHPCADCPELSSHLRWVGRWRKARLDLERRPAPHRGTNQLTRPVSSTGSPTCCMSSAIWSARARSCVPTSQRPAAAAPVQRPGSARSRSASSTAPGRGWTRPVWPRWSQRPSTRPVGTTAPRRPSRTRRSTPPWPRPPGSPPTCRSPSPATGSTRPRPPDPAISAIVHRWARGRPLRRRPERERSASR